MNNAAANIPSKTALSRLIRSFLIFELLIDLVQFLDDLLEEFDPLARFLGVAGIGVLVDHVVEVDQRAPPFLSLLVILGRFVGASGLLGSERIDDLLRFLDLLVLGVE